jgi:hypothetical protein
MAEEPKSVCEWLEIELDKLSADDKINLISEVYEELTAQQLRGMRDLAEEKRLEKLESAKAQVIEEMREKFVQLDLDFDEVMGVNRRRGRLPQWIRDLEEEGGDSEDYRISEEG